LAGGNRRDRRQQQAASRRGARPVRPIGALDRARALLAAGRAGEAFDAFREAAAAQPPDVRARAAFADFLIAHVPGQPHPDVDAAFTAALDQGWLRPETLAPAAIRYLEAGARDVIGTLPDLTAPGVAALLAHPVLRALLRATPAATPRLEIFLARVRYRTLVDGVRAEMHGFLRALAERALVSGFALTLPATDADALADEAGRLPDLRAAATAARGDADAVLLLACYEPVDGLPDAAWQAPALAELHRVHVAAPRYRAAIAETLAPLTALDASSEVVAAQYEAHPYPLWVREPIGLPVAVPPPVARLADPARVRQVLVAGCGTGQHALVAADRWPRAELLAIDLSRASLAHGIARTEALGIKRIRFALADLLAIGSLGRRWPVIEAVGVLHHLDDPQAGLAALAQVLAPGGVMLVALYSRRARARLAEARALVGGAAQTSAEIRAFRSQALVRLDAPEITHSPDFYSIGGCRDLVFHVREQSYDLLEIGAMVAAAGLEVLALEAPASPVVAAPDPTDLAGWDAIERGDPMLFGAMYALWLKAR
jgi:SAM-dependent methyltransferase